MLERLKFWRKPALNINSVEVVLARERTRAVADYQAMSPVDRAIYTTEQRLQIPSTPDGMLLLKEYDPAVVLMNEVKRLRAINQQLHPRNIYQPLHSDTKL